MEIGRYLAPRRRTLCRRGTTPSQTHAVHSVHVDEPVGSKLIDPLLFGKKNTYTSTDHE